MRKAGMGGLTWLAVPDVQIQAVPGSTSSACLSRFVPPGSAWSCPLLSSRSGLLFRGIIMRAELRLLAAAAARHFRPRSEALAAWLSERPPPEWPA
jgi:hypothetical protein